ncbi:MAG: hypothetical protein ACREA2_04030 [Blastocatellia bacterium]
MSEATMHKTTQRQLWIVALVAAFLAGAFGPRQIAWGQKNGEIAQTARPSSPPASESLPPPSTRLLRGYQVERFYEPLYWLFSIGSAIGGLAVGLYLAKKLKLEVDDGFNANAKAMLKFYICWALFCVASALLFLLAVYGSDYGPYFLQLLLNMQFVLLAIISNVAFVGAAALTTRFAPGSRCPYMLIPGPKIKQLK